MIRVLIVDDSLFIRTILKDMLSNDSDIEVIGTASNGEEALKQIQILSPDLMTLDIEMPKMTGIEVLEHRNDFKAFPKTLVLSALTSEGAEMTKKALALGADDFLLKPKRISNVRKSGSEIKQKIRNIISLPYIHTKQAVHDTLAQNVVFIGSSAGGPPMLDIILSSLPAKLNAAVLVTQHMPVGGFTASLAARLNKISPLIIKETEPGDVLKNNCAYISKAGVHTIVSKFSDKKRQTGGKIIHTKSPPVHNVIPAVDNSFISGARVFGPKTVSVILSGMGHDGGIGTKAIKQSGGATIVCRKEDCLVYGMPGTAIETNCVDYVLPLKKISDKIVVLINSMAV